MERCNIGFIIGDSVCDHGEIRKGIALLNAIKQITPKPICYVINTFVHPAISAMLSKEAGSVCRAS